MSLSKVTSLSGFDKLNLTIKILNQNSQSDPLPALGKILDILPSQIEITEWKILFNPIRKWKITRI